jgi:MtN3 and saliva related transmembrane protein
MAATEWLGYLAALGTTSAYAPQVVKVVRTRRTQDISLKAFLVLVTGQALWLTYGVMGGDWPLILSNAVTLLFTGTILAFKLREVRAERRG